MRTARGKSACWRAKRTDKILIAMYQLDQNYAHRFFTRLNSVFNSLAFVLGS